jgi:hypothetical protein
VILSRKAEIERLEAEGEEGMVHSVLSGLPELFDGEASEGVGGDGEEGDGVKVEVGGEEDDDEWREELAPAPATATELVVDIDIDSGSITEGNFLDGSAMSSSLSFGHENEHENDLHDPQPQPQPHSQNSLPWSNPNPDTPPSASIHTTPHDPNASEKIDSSLSSLSPSLSPSFSPSFSPSPSPTPSSSTTSLSSLLHKTRTRISLPALLTHADALHALYPPTHPGLGIREIMGPGSVVFTWSEVDYGGKEDGGGEGEGGLLGDDEAAEMVSHPELVVYPYIEPHHPSPSSPFSSEKHNPQTKPKRYETRTAVIIGAVIVLGVSVGVAAFYGARGSRGGGGGGGWSWRKVGGKLIGAGESLRVVDGLGFW